MGLFPKISKRSFSNIVDPAQWLIDAFAGGGESLAGPNVNQDSALGVSAVYSCVTCISETIASLPMILYREKKSGGRERIKQHNLYDLLKNKPNDEMTSFSMKESQSSHLLLWGNKFSFIERDRLDRVLSLYPITPNRVTVERNEALKIVYHVIDINGKENVYSSDKILHTPGFSFNGLFGQSVISIQREKLGTALALDEFEGRFFGDGTHPSAVIKLPPGAGGMDEKTQKQYLAKLTRDFSGLGKTHGLVVLPNGEEMIPMTMPLNDAQFIDLYKAKGTDVCGWFKVPPHMVGILDKATFSNIEHQAIQFAVHCIRPWLVRDEQSINVKLLSSKERRDGLYVENTIDALLRGDVQARSEFYQTMFQIGAMSPNDIREKENMNPYSGGKNRFVPLNMVPADMAEEIVSLEKKANQDEPEPKEPEPKEPKEPEEKEKKSLEAREKRSIIVRDRITSQYKPLIRKAANDIVKHEVDAIRKHAGKRSIDNWFNDFYRDFQDYIKDTIGPVLKSFAGAMRDSASDTIGTQDKPVDIDKFIDDYIDSYALRHANTSRNQLSSMTDDEIDERVGEWEETKADKITENETTRSGSAVFQFVVFSVGMATIWRTRGASTCKYCKKLRGKKVRSGQHFVGKGEVIAPKGEPPMRSSGIKRHPPLHGGCDCYLGVG